MFSQQRITPTTPLLICGRVGRHFGLDSDPINGEVLIKPKPDLLVCIHSNSFYCLALSEKNNIYAHVVSFEII